MNEKVNNTGRFSALFKNQSLFLIIIMIVIGVAVSLINPRFLTLNNLLNIVLQVSVTGIICVGMGTVLISGNFDLTIGPMITILGYVMTKMIARTSIGVTLLTVVVVGMAIGAVNGILVTRIKAHSFIVTLALATIYNGVALLLSGGRYGFLEGKFGYFTGKIWGVIPRPAVVFVVIVVGVFILYRYTRFGRLLFAIGGNEDTAYLAGVKVRLYKILALSLAGGLYGIASIVLVSQLGLVMNSTGTPYTLTALAAIVIGGVALAGGKGSALGIFLGAVMFGLISNSLILTGVDPFWRDVVLGFIILLAVAVSGIVSQRK